MSIQSYSKIYAIGHRAIENLFTGPVLVQEKVDGSQFSFANIDGELKCRSKGADLVVDAPEGMFQAAVDTAKRLFPLLTPGWVYRGEYLQKPKHNTLAYDRVPALHIILFDVATGIETYLDDVDLYMEAARLGLESVPVLMKGEISDAETLKGLLDRVSVLGGQKIEGVVVKNYNQMSLDKRVAMGKFVSEAFKEVHGGEWRKNNPPAKDVLDQLIERYRTPARWDKAVQHIRERGELDGSPKDIGALIREVPADVLAECEDEIKEILFKHYWPKISRGLTAGIAEWYKISLIESAFDEEE